MDHIMDPGRLLYTLGRTLVGYIHPRYPGGLYTTLYMPPGYPFVGSLPVHAGTPCSTAGGMYTVRCAGFTLLARGPQGRGSFERSLLKEEKRDIIDRF